MIVEATPEDYAALLDGRAPRDFRLADTPIERVEVLRMLADLALQVGRALSPASWLIIDDNEVVGSCAVMRPPAGGVIDIGYGIAPSRQGRGIAGRAIGEVINWARTTPGIVAVTADTSVANLPSQRVLARNGFIQIGARHDDEDGAMICWRHLLDGQ